jgi:hypothetical protein
MVGYGRVRLFNGRVRSSTVQYGSYTVGNGCFMVKNGQVRSATVMYDRLRSCTIGYGHVRSGTVQYGSFTVGYGLERFGNVILCMRQLYSKMFRLYYYIINSEAKYFILFKLILRDKF